MSKMNNKTTKINTSKKQCDLIAKSIVQAITLQKQRFNSIIHI